MKFISGNIECPENNIPMNNEKPIPLKIDGYINLPLIDSSSSSGTWVRVWSGSGRFE